MQQIEVFFGFRVTLERDATANTYANHQAEIANALRGAGIRPGQVKVYVCNIRVEIAESHFGVSRLSQRLALLDIHVATPKSLREDSRIYFLNDKIQHSINRTARTTFEKFDLRYSVEGSHFDSADRFTELMYVVVENSVKRERRRVRVNLLASPTTSFATKLINVRKASTKLDLPLEPRIQLVFDF